MPDNIATLRDRILEVAHSAKFATSVAANHTIAGNIMISWWLGDYRLSGKVRSNALIVLSTSGMSEENVDAFIDEVLYNVPEADQPLQHIAFQIANQPIVADVCARRNFNRYEIGESVFYWSEVNSQLRLF